MPLFRRRVRVLAVAVVLVAAASIEFQSASAGTIPALYIGALTQAENGAWPVGLFGTYPADHVHLRMYIEQARTDEGFQSYLDDYVLGRKAAE